MSPPEDIPEDREYCEECPLCGGTISLFEGYWSCDNGACNFEPVYQEGEKNEPNQKQKPNDSSGESAPDRNQGRVELPDLRPHKSGESPRGISAPLPGENVRGHRQKPGMPGI